jgi:3-oxoacyl-[acyl-carrier protein] reductase
VPRPSKKISTKRLNPFSWPGNQFDSYRNVEVKAFDAGDGIMKNLEGNVALVTGASKGIGAAIARELAERGAAVAVNYSGSKAAAEKIVAEINAAGGKAIAVQANVADPDQVGPLVKTVAQKLGPIDVLVNNAGVYEFGPLEAVTPEHFHKQFDLNVLGLLLTTKEAVAQFNPNGGSVINISSVAADGIGGGAVYSATKGAVDSVSQALAQELGPKKIRVNSVNPGMILTEGVRAAGLAGSDFEKESVKRTPLGRIGQPQDIASIVAFLASDESVWVNGQVIHAAGGFRI